MNWLYKWARPEGWLESQGVDPAIIEFAINDRRFPRKMQKWVALALKSLAQQPEGAQTGC